MMAKVLYFEGAGMDFYSEKQTNYSDVGNFRIRSAFKNLDGIEYYIELSNCSRFNDKYKVITDFALRIDHLFKLEDRHKEEFRNGGYEIKTNHLEDRKIDYTKEDITKWINYNLNCNFDTIQVLDRFYGYNVHGDNGTYNLMENIELDHERAAKRKELYNIIDKDYKEYTNSKYSVISLLSMEDDSMTIKCYASDEKLGNWPRIQKLAVIY